MAAGQHQPSESVPERVWVWGVPCARVTMEQTLAYAETLIARRQPSYIITANLNYAMLTDAHPELHPVNAGAALIVADGMPLVWASRFERRRLPERVTGADLIWRLSERAAQRGYRVFLLGGAPGIAELAAQNLVSRWPALQVVGTYAPPFRALTAEEHQDLVQRVRSAHPEILFAAFGQPHGEQWLAAHCGELRVPVCLQIGAAIDFVAGKVPRAPRWVQRLGLEWAYRLYREPRRLVGRYLRNAWFVGRMLMAHQRCARLPRNHREQ